MADADKSLDILIRTKAELAGAKDAEAALERQIGKAKALGKDYSDLTVQLDRTRASIKQFENSQEQDDKKTEVFSGHLGEAKKLLRELGQEFPIAAAAGRFFLNSTVGVITAIIAGFGAAKRQIEDWTKAAEEAAAEAAKPEFEAGIEAKRQALHRATLDAAAYADEMAHLVTPEKAFQDALAKTLELTKQISAAQGKVVDARQKLDLAVLEKAFNQGLISEENYLQQKAALEIRANDEQLKRITEAQQKELKIKMDALVALDKKRDEVAKTVKDKEAVSTTTGTKTDKDKADLTRAEEALADAKAKERDAQKAGEEHAGSLSELQRMAEADLFGMGRSSFLFRQYNEAHGLTEARRREVEKLRGTVSADEATGGQATRETTRAQDAERDINRQMQELTNAIDLLRTTISATGSLPQKATAIANTTALINTMSRDQLMQYITSNAEGQQAIIEDLVKRNRELEARIKKQGNK